MPRQREREREFVENTWKNVLLYYYYYYSKDRFIYIKVPMNFLFYYYCYKKNRTLLKLITIIIISRYWLK